MESIHLAGVEYRPLDGADNTSYPFGVPLIRSLKTLPFKAPVTILVGENGSGKSTLLEAIAVAAKAVTVGAESVMTDRTLEPARALAKHLRLQWKKRTHRGFFLRAEDFFNFCRRTAELRSEMQAEFDRVESAYADKSILARQLARGVYAKSVRALDDRYGSDLHANSHGESFLKLFQARMVPNGLYLLDEPETPLSPARQLSFLSLMMSMVQQDCQFIVATHSPILMACPGAVILSCDRSPATEVPYSELEHVQLTKSFLNNPEQFLRHLI